VPRFVVLQHDSPAGLHWDFMLELQGVLKTWALDGSPDDPNSRTARPLPDHRLHYLDYEGEVSGGRGQVVCWDRGQYELLSRNDNAWEVRLAGQKLVGRASLQRDDGTQQGDQAWQFDWQSERP